MLEYLAAEVEHLGKIEQEREAEGERREWERQERQHEQLEKERKREEVAAAREAERQRKELERRAEREEDRRRREEERKKREEYIEKRDEERRQEKLEKKQEEQRKEQEKLEAERLEQQALEEARKPRPIPQEAFYEHVHVIGGSGSGKSTLITERFAELLFREDQPSIIVIDPKGQLVDALSRIDYKYYDFDYADKFVIIDPTKFAPALNMFAKAPRHYEEHIGDQIENNLISLFQYIFSTRESRLTEKQLTCFSFCVKLLFRMPEATIGTFLELLRDPLVGKAGGIRPDSPFKPYIDQLDYISRNFFYNNFYDASDYSPTKDQIATRIFGMLRYKTFQDIFLQERARSTCSI